MCQWRKREYPADCQPVDDACGKPQGQEIARDEREEQRVTECEEHPQDEVCDIAEDAVSINRARCLPWPRASARGQLVLRPHPEGAAMSLPVILTALSLLSVKQ
jgi:hypothetical protein